ncbi:BRO-N domain-containing protein [Virgibacillus pantothenticus]|uniref:BRO-N domain-containing protein n=1 Tax=Virgibacillus pantothenticus TaxID=1473 RepID=UPI000984128C|nr:BRO family protein [Virgibacillus pantothenticus]
MNELQTFENELFKVSAKQEGEQIMFDVEEVAKSLGITDKKNGTEYVRWSRVNSYLPENSPLVAKGDLIPEPLVYKLAFKASNEIAEKFQDWLAIEVIPQIRKTGSYGLDTSQLSPELQMVNGLFQSLARQELETKILKEEMKSTNEKVDNFSEILALNPTQWRKKVNAIINKIAQKRGGAYQDVRNESYQLLEERGKCILSIRKTNKQRKMALEGVVKSRIDKVTKMDVIADDARLTEIYLAVVKELAIKHNINIERSEFQ